MQQQKPKETFRKPVEETNRRKKLSEIVRKLALPVLSSAFLLSSPLFSQTLPENTKSQKESVEAVDVSPSEKFSSPETESSFNFHTSLEYTIPLGSELDIQHKELSFGPLVWEIDSGNIKVERTSLEFLINDPSRIPQWLQEVFYPNIRQTKNGFVLDMNAQLLATAGFDFSLRDDNLISSLSLNSIGTFKAGINANFFMKNKFPSSFTLNTSESDFTSSSVSFNSLLEFNNIEENKNLLFFIEEGRGKYDYESYSLYSNLTFPPLSADVSFSNPNLSLNNNFATLGTEYSFSIPLDNFDIQISSGILYYRTLNEKNYNFDIYSAGLKFVPPSSLTYYYKHSNPALLRKTESSDFYPSLALAVNTSSLKHFVFGAHVRTSGKGVSSYSLYALQKSSSPFFINSMLLLNRQDNFFYGKTTNKQLDITFSSREIKEIYSPQELNSPLTLTLFGLTPDFSGIPSHTFYARLFAQDNSFLKEHISHENHYGFELGKKFTRNAFSLSFTKNDGSSTYTTGITSGNFFFSLSYTSGQRANMLSEGASFTLGLRHKF